MKMVGRNLAVLLVLSFAFLTYRLIPSIPDELEEKWKYGLMITGLKIIRMVVTCKKYLFPSAESGPLNTATAGGSKAASTWALESSSTDHLGPGVTTLEDNFNGTKVVIYRPPLATADKLLPGFVYMHGGGLAHGSAKTHDGIARMISFRLKAVVVNIDYDTTPRVKFPVPINQCFTAAKWFLLHGKDYGVDSERVAVGGDSSGGFLAASVSQLIHDDQSVPNLKMQFLIYPWTQCLDFHFPSYQEYTKRFGPGEGLVNREAMVKFCTMHAWGSTDPKLMQKLKENRHVGPSFKQSALYRETFGHHLLPETYRASPFYEGPSPLDEGEEEFWASAKDIFLDPRFTPHFRKNMTGLPTAYVVTTGLDSLRDEGYLYAQQLKNAGVEVTLVHYETAWHGSFWTTPYTIFKIGSRMHEDMLEFARGRL